MKKFLTIALSSVFVTGVLLFVITSIGSTAVKDTKDTTVEIQDVTGGTLPPELIITTTEIPAETFLFEDVLDAGTH
jgi:hypothetical protein